MMEPPLFPFGEFEPPRVYDTAVRQSLISELEGFPEKLRAATEALSETELDTRFRNWTVRQIVHHLADSHINCYVRFKWTLTEATPTIKSYNESLWSEVVDATSGPIESSLTILSGIHARWGQLLQRMTDDDFSKGFMHPELGAIVTLNDALPNYVWHGKHHLAQIEWVISNRLQ